MEMDTLTTTWAGTFLVTTTMHKWVGVTTGCMWRAALLLQQIMGLVLPDPHLDARIFQLKLVMAAP